MTPHGLYILSQKKHTSEEFAKIMEAINNMRMDILDRFIRERELKLRKEVMGLIRLKEYRKIKKLTSNLAEKK